MRIVKNSYISTCLYPTTDTFIPWDRKLHKYGIKYNTAYFSSIFCRKFSLLTIKYVTLNLEIFAIFIDSFFFHWSSNTFVTFDHCYFWVCITLSCALPWSFPSGRPQMIHRNRNAELYELYAVKKDRKILMFSHTGLSQTFVHITTPQAIFPQQHKISLWERHQHFGEAGKSLKSVWKKDSFA